MVVKGEDDCRLRANDTIRVMSVEPHPIFREGLSTIIDSQQDMMVVAEAANAEEAFAKFRTHRPDVTLMDVLLPGVNGTNMVKTIRGEFPDARLIMLTSCDGDGEIQRAMRAGAAAYLLKSTPKAELVSVIRSVHSGRRYISSGASACVAEHMCDDALTSREVEVLRLIRNGHRNKEIAAALSIALTTVSFHVKNIIGKLGANDRTHAVTIAVRRGLVGY